MIDYLRSNALKKFYEENHIEPADKLKYGLIVNSYNPIPEIIESLKELMATTGDEEIKAQGPVWIKNAEREIEILSRDSGPKYCYKGQYRDRRDEDVVFGCFRTLEMAVKEGMELAKEEDFGCFEVIKEFIPASKEELEAYEEDKTGAYDTAEATFSADGKMKRCWAFTPDAEELEDPIEDRFYDMPHPFKRGDIVKSKDYPEDSKDIYIVTQDYEDSQKYCEQKKGWFGSLEWGDIWVRVEHIDLETGFVWDVDEPVLPSELEYYPVEDRTEDIGERVLLDLSDLYKGKPFSLQHIQNGLMMLQEQYDEKQKYNLLYGSVLKKSTMQYIFG